MAITHRLYRTARSTNPATGRACSALQPYILEVTDYLDPESGQVVVVPEAQRSSFHVWTFEPDYRAFYAHAWCESSVHAQCAADPLVTPLSPELADVAALQTWLDGQIGTQITALRNILEGDRIPFGGLTSISTRRQALRRVRMISQVSCLMRGDRDFVALDFLLANLTTKRSELSANVRTRILAWLTEHGLSASWTTANTTVAQLLDYVIDNLVLDPVRFPPKLHQLEIL